MAIKSIDNYIVDMFSQMKGISVQGIKNFAGNLKPTTNKDIIKEMKVQTDILEETNKNSQKLYKAFDKMVKLQQEQLLAKSVENTNTGTDKPNVFDEKNKVQKSIVGQVHPLHGVVSSIKDDTKRIVDLLEQSIKLEKENNNKGSRFGDFNIGGLAKYLPLLALATASAPTVGSGIHAGASLLPTAGRVASGAGHAIKAGAGAIRAGGGIANALSTATQAGRTTGGLNAKNLLVGEQKIGALGKIGAVAGAGATVGRAMEGDTFGATVQGISTALPLILSKTKFGKIASLASGAMDVGLLGRDYLKGKEVEEAKKQEEQAQLEPTNQIASNTAETNRLLSEIASGKHVPQQSASGGTGMALGLGAMALLGGGAIARRTGLGAVTSAGGGLLGALGRGATGASAGAGALGTGLKVGAGALGKTALKSLPFIGLGMGAYGAYEKTKEGDYKGAILEATSGIASMIPVYGTAISLGLQGISATRDVMRATNAETTANVTKNNEAVTSNITSASDKSNEQIAKATDNTTSALISANALTNKSIADSSAVANGSIANSAQTLNNTGTSLSSILTNASNTFLGMVTKFGMLGIATTTTGMAIDAVQGLFKTDKEKLRSKLGQGDMTGVSLGGVSEAFESGGRGVGTVSGGKGDKGGVSYGKHQLSSKSGTMKEFLNSQYGQKYKADLMKYEIGSDQFNTTYKTIAKFKGDQFEKDQKAFIDKTHFGVQANAIKSRTGIDIKKRGRAVTELVYSMAVQYRNLTPSIFEKALGKNANQLSDREIIERVMNYREQNVNSHFHNSSASTRQAIGGRIKTEKEMLLNIQAKNPNALYGNVGNDTAGAKGSSVSKANASSTTGSTSASGGTNSSKNNPAKNADFDLDKVCAVAVSRAQKKSTRDCAKFVRIALQAGDNKKRITGGMGNANEWNKSLPKIGFVAVGQTAPKKGDVAHIPPNPYSKIGHVCIFTGSQWVSDYIQKSMNPYAGDVPYTIYRAKSGYSNGSAVTAGEGTDIDASTVDGVTGSSEGKQDTPDSLFQSAYDSVTGGVASLFNSDAMQSIKDFMKGDIYKTSDKTPIPKALGDFTKDIDEADPNRKLRGAGNNGEADDLLGALGGDDILRQQRHLNYENVKRALGGTNDIQRQERPDNYEEVKRALGGTDQIQRQMGGNNKNKWWMGLFNNLFGGNDLLSGIFGLATGQRKLSDLTPQEILGQVQGAIGKGGIFEGGGFNGRAIGKMLGMDASGAIADMANGGFGGGFGGSIPSDTSTSTVDKTLPNGDTVLIENADGSIVEHADGSWTNTLPDGRSVTYNADGTIKQINRTGNVSADTGFKEANQKSGTSFASKVGSFLGIPKANIDSYAFGGGFGGAIGYAEPEAGTRVYAGDNDPDVMPEPHAGDIGYAINQRMAQLEGDVEYDPTEKMADEREMQMAKYQIEEERRQQAQVSVNVPPTVQTPTGKDPRGKSPQDGLGGSMIVKNPDTIIHTVAVTMMGNSV